MPTGIYKRITLKERMLRSFTVDKKTKCWNWSLFIDHNGYGNVRVNEPVRTNRKAHRIMYELLKGKIPEDMFLDHLCRNRKCVNPSHLEAVTMKENVLRGIGVTSRNSKKTHCSNGHEFTGKNLILSKLGRVCKVCKLWNTYKWRNPNATQEELSEKMKTYEKLTK